MTSTADSPSAPLPADLPGNAHRHRAWSTFRSCAPERVRRIVDALQQDGSTVILVGDHGVGKLTMALEAVSELQRSLGLAGEVVTVQDESELGPGVLETVQERGVGFLVLEGIDGYGRQAARILARLAGTPGLRVVATARRIRGGAAQVASQYGVRRLPVAALSFREMRRYVCLLLGCEAVEELTLRRWYHLTGGNFSSVTTLALACEEEGGLGRRQGLVWDRSVCRRVPAELTEDLLSRCSGDELEVLQLIAEAEPIAEESLQRLIPRDQLAGLVERGFVDVGRQDSGACRITFSQPLYAMAVTALTPSARRQEINAQLYEALLLDLGRRDPTAAAGTLARLVRFGLEAGRELPVEWLFAALSHMVRTGADQCLRARVATMMAGHQEVNSTQLAKAAVWVGTDARFIGDADLAAAAHEWGLRAEPRLKPVTATPDRLYAALQVRLATYEAVDQGDLAACTARLDALEAATRHAAASIRLSVRSARIAATAAAGHLGDPGETMSEEPGLLELPVERARFWRAVATSLVLAQRGRFVEAAGRSDVAATMIALGGAGYAHNAQLLGFCTFLSQWFAGALELAGETLAQLQKEALNGNSDSGLVDLADALHANALGRWREAERKAHLLILRLSDHDPYVVRPLARAVLALALAGLGQRAASAQAIRIAETDRFGVALMARGILLTLTLRARVWNQAPDTAEVARAVANWAASDRLPMVELVAMHVRGQVDARCLPQFLPRLKVLAEMVDSPAAGVILQHCQELATLQPAWETPAARMLAAFGAWMPLPAAPQLSAREREIAMLAALGYSSKWIAEHHHLSVRTVETHLRHVFTKIGTTNRDELRAWFRRESAGG